MKLVSQKQVLSPNAPPQVNSDLLKTNSSKSEKNAMITKEFLAKTIKGNNAFDYWVMDVPISFDNPLLFMRYLKSLGASGSNNKMSLIKLKELLQEQKEPLTVSYKIF